ncbi:MAG: CDP-alcohol phosphatidyltransferase family protein [Lachnospiraceae bacterium]|uniref:CDP-diacylglycerol--glycerol-3-phosphate 3-phosphatidyltransferase n=1 Tax=Dorea phocaeensis TaxID=2040291 RepID=A0A850HF83_9FIRM|nr:phospholipase D-like domain-containing protein [Dorea phocaeensis]MBS5133311.1 CDP-alcohol phosphatidyltransferase family protein [Lachnospiraceae bacterium]NSK13955.1 CDP-diacylglycerol--glycerol-3-phosphate 3-phosphatidyltransferase [Dorea phocaeensis]NVH57958.1 CDP-diacylglycerol--glycerol-3-phosphate 3-phosphatidyltransferase [Dorea phocaeensis]
MKWDKREYFSIPNLMGYFRILLIPIYLIVYIRADSVRDYQIAAGIMVLSFLSDFLDGKIARRFNMVTEFGKILDPIADKMTQGTLALSFTFRYPVMGVLLLLFLLKETIMGILGAYMMHKGYRMGGAKMHGKICTAVLDLVMFLVLLLPNLPYLAVNLMVAVSVCVMAVSLCLYLRMYWNAWKQQKGSQEEIGAEKRRSRKMVIVIIAAVLVLFALGAILPFARQPKVTEKTKKELEVERFYSDQPSGERAKVISDNGEALEERLRLISQAEEEIILSTFEFDSDTSGTQMIAALADAAARGVKVRVLVDGFPYLTTMWGNPKFLALAQTENVEIRVYNPVRPWKPWGIMGRLHDKYLIADRTAYILGGRNTFDFFLGDQKGYKNYDWDMLVYTKEASGDSSLEQVRSYFESVWKMPECKTFGKSRFWKQNPSVKKAEGEIADAVKTLKEAYGDELGKIDYESITLPVNQIQLISNPTHILAKEPVVFYTITELMKQAKEEVVFHTPYVICDDWMLERLNEVCEGDKDVKMMTNSVANNGNPFGAMDYQKNKEKICDTGVEILEYDKGVSYHGKCFTIDDRLAAIGSFNWDMRSAYLDTELMLVVDSREVNEQLRDEMKKYEQHALKVTGKDTYEVPEGVERQELSAKKKFRIAVLKTVAGWARFLM